MEGVKEREGIEEAEVIKVDTGDRISALGVEQLIFTTKIETKTIEKKETVGKQLDNTSNLPEEAITNNGTIRKQIV